MQEHTAAAAPQMSVSESIGKPHPSDPLAGSENWSRWIFGLLPLLCGHSLSCIQMYSAAPMDPALASAFLIGPRRHRQLPASEAVKAAGQRHLEQAVLISRTQR